jgi:thioredoxin reductase
VIVGNQSTRDHGVMLDVLIVGGGPAGLSAALILGRSRRNVLLCDDRTPRNEASRELHGYLTRDGVSPAEFLQLGREELRRYGVEQRQVRVVDVRRHVEGFDVGLADGERVLARLLLLATGVRDRLPDVPGLKECYGRSAHHCPYCDGWEVLDKRIVVLGDERSPAGLALSLKTWTQTVVACRTGRTKISSAHRKLLAAKQIALHDSPIAVAHHTNGQVRAVGLTSGEQVECDAIFFAAPQEQQCDLPRQLGCEFTRKGTVKTDHLGSTCVPGVYVVGDASRDVQFVIVAAAEGAKAGVAINGILQERAGLTIERRPEPAEIPANL